MSNAPWFRWFAADYRRKTLHLTFVEDAAYRRMIDAYMEQRGPLPADRKALYRLCSAQEEEERSAVDKIAIEFFKNGDGRLKHARCDREIANQESQSEQRIKSAAHAARTRWAMRGECGKMPDSDSDSDSKPKTKPKPIRPVPPEGFMKFWKSYPPTSRRVARFKCLSVWVAKGLESSAEQIVEHVLAMRKTQAWIDGYEPAPLTYLNQRRWEDGLPATKTRRLEL